MRSLFLPRTQQCPPRPLSNVPLAYRCASRKRRSDEAAHPRPAILVVGLLLVHLFYDRPPDGALGFVRRRIRVQHVVRVHLRTLARSACRPPRRAAAAPFSKCMMRGPGRRACPLPRVGSRCVSAASLKSSPKSSSAVLPSMASASLRAHGGRIHRMPQGGRLPARRLIAPRAPCSVLRSDPGCAARDARCPPNARPLVTSPASLRRGPAPEQDGQRVSPVVALAAQQVPVQVRILQPHEHQATRRQVPGLVQPALILHNPLLRTAARPPDGRQRGARARPCSRTRSASRRQAPLAPQSN